MFQEGGYALRKKWLTGITLAALGAASVGFLVTRPAQSSDHADTPDIAANPSTDLSDVFMFPSKENPNNVVLVMCVNPLITSGNIASARFDPNVLYQFKIDNTGDAVEDVVIQAKFDNSATQKVSISGPIKPSSPGTVNVQEKAYSVTGTINAAFSPTAGMNVFAGVREDPFFFDLERFFEIFPDRGVPTGLTQPPANPNQPQAVSWRDAATARDFLSSGPFGSLNVLAIVVEVPRERLLQ